jgi:preprotein translocase subunit Sec63
MRNRVLFFLASIACILPLVVVSAYHASFETSSFDPFKELGLDHGAAPNTIRAKFIKLAKACHPDKTHGETGDGGERFKRVRRAYETLIADQPPEPAAQNEAAQRGADKQSQAGVSPPLVLCPRSTTQHELRNDVAIPQAAPHHRPEMWPGRSPSMTSAL